MPVSRPIPFISIFTGRSLSEETVSDSKVRSTGDPGSTWFGFVRERMLGFWMLVR